MTHAQIDEIVADFELPSTGDKIFRLSEQRGKKVLIYFYPKDNTPGCTIEGQNFRDNIDFFNAHNVVIVGVSRDGLKAHENFKSEQNFPFELLSDKEELACRLFDVIKPKKLYGKEHMGIVRSTFLIDEAGVLVKLWRNVKAKEHVNEVMEFIESI